MKDGGNQPIQPQIEVIGELSDEAIEAWANLLVNTEIGEKEGVDQRQIEKLESEEQSPFCED